MVESHLLLNTLVSKFGVKVLSVHFDTSMGILLSDHVSKQHEAHAASLKGMRAILYNNGGTTMEKGERKGWENSEVPSSSGQQRSGVGGGIQG